MKEKQFIDKGARKVRLDEFLERELEGAGYSHSDLVRTPTSTKIVIYAQRPGLVIGRGGSRIRELTADMEEEFEFDNPQIEVNEIEDADSDAEIVAKSMASWLEKGGSAKRVGYTYLRRVKESGVIGVEIEISGKLSGNRGRTEKFSYGYVKRCGNTSKESVDSAYTLARTKPGAIGLKVRIMKELPDFKHRNVDVTEEILHETVDGETKTEQIAKIIAEAENMTAAAIEEAAEVQEIDMEKVTVDEVRDVFEEMDADEASEVESEEDEADQETEEETESEEAEDEVEETESEDESDESDVDYAEIVSGTIGDAKDALNDLENVDWEKALQAEKDDKNRTTFIDWLESKV
ncbi:30S ribosomal protein S3 [Candidatus Nanohalococcus occultus]|uniref:Small ribosomal subunit protein uS3 n=1 Tax=Candidatus Nanohalococcus occultus TaxID=2978047 RepID=A0ABY8CDA9_9ARCH|nr:Ribosomal protein S3 [Candidatus Nanohaloarchaeota archaeon SVXNc]